MGLGDPPALQWDLFQQRHLLGGNLGKSAPANMPNSIVTNPAWQSKSVIEGFYKEAVGLAKAAGKTQMDVVLSNGTTWNVNVKDGHFYPVKGNGITNLSKIETAVLRAAKANGAKGEAVFANLAKNPNLGTFSAEMQTAVKSLAEIEGVSTGTVLRHLADNFPTTAEPVAGANQAAKAKFGSASRYIKWGGRALLVVAVAVDLYEIYNSENKARTITKKAGFWAGALAGGAAAGSATVGANVIPFWGQVINIGATIGGGIVGGLIGEKITETVYDWIFTKEK
jgi:hypothetical protein